MTTTCIYDLDGGIVTEGLQSALRSDEALQVARRIAKTICASVVVEDEEAEECYRVTPGGHIWRAPRGWTPSWTEEG